MPYISVAQNTVEFYYTDSVKNYVPYQYRIVRLTPWVDRSNSFVVIKVMGRDRTPASPSMNTRAKGDRSKIVVTREFTNMKATMFSLNHNTMLVKRSNSISSGLNYNRIRTAASTNVQYGATVGYSQSFLSSRLAQV